MGSRIFQDAADHDTDFCPRTFAKRPVDGDAFANRDHQFGGDHLEFGDAHHLHGTLVHGQGVVESHFVVVQSQFCTASCTASRISFAKRMSSSMTSWVAMARLW